jgi:general secretion pathway protein D
VLKCLQILSLAVAAAVVCAGADGAARMFEAGEKAAKAGDNLKAYLLYSQAAKLDPGNRVYAQRRAAAQGTASANPVQVTSDPANGAGEAASPETVRPEAAELLAEPVPTLSLKPGRQSFDLRGDAGELFEKVAGAFGIQVTMDRDYRPPASSLRFRIEDATAPEALRVLEAATDSFLTPLSEHLAIVARDTAQKRTELTPVTAVGVPIPERLSVQEGQEISTAVQQTLEIKRVSLDAAKRMVYFRDTQPKALAARQMFANLSRTRAQVEVDVELISVSKTSTLSYGLSLPNSASLVDFGKVLGNKVTQAGNYFVFGGGATLMGLGIANAAAFATLSSSSADTLLQAQVVALDGQSATLKVGDRYPVITSNYTAGVTGTSALSPSLAPPIQFVDLGLVLKITPVVHADFEMTLDVDAQFKTLGSASVNSIPVIASQQYQGKVRLKDGEWAVIAGLVTMNDSETPTGIAGLADLPWIGRLFSHQTHEKDKSEVMIVLKPRLVALPPWETATPSLWTGTETRPLTPF